jgi:NNP family nitrate/nitrite transporter-like MFS transporter
MDHWKFRRAGHPPTLLCAFLYFTVSCMVWMMVGALANSIVLDLGPLTDSRKGLMVAVPVLGGALLRLLLGPLADHIGAKQTALIGLALTLVPLLLGWL